MLVTNAEPQRLLLLTVTQSIYFIAIDNLSQKQNSPQLPKDGINVRARHHR